jgi:hypothetical protein
VAAFCCTQSTLQDIRLTFGLNSHVFVTDVKLPADQHVVLPQPFTDITCLEPDLLQSCLYPLLTISPSIPLPPAPFIAWPTKVKTIIVTPTWSWWFVARPLRALASGYSVRVLSDRISCGFRSRAVKVVAGLTCASRRHLWHHNCCICVWSLVTETGLILEVSRGVWQAITLGINVLSSKKR